MDDGAVELSDLVKMNFAVFQNTTGECSVTIFQPLLQLVTNVQTKLHIFLPKPPTHRPLGLVTNREIVRLSARISLGVSLSLSLLPFHIKKSRKKSSEFSWKTNISTRMIPILIHHLTIRSVDQFYRNLPVFHFIIIKAFSCSHPTSKILQNYQLSDVDKIQGLFNHAASL